MQAVKASDVSATVRERIVDLYRHVWPTAQEPFEGCYGLEAVWHMAWCGDRLKGFVTTHEDAHHQVHVYNLCVHPDYRRTGVGRRLLQQVRTYHHAATQLFGYVAPTLLSFYTNLCPLNTVKTSTEQFRVSVQLDQLSKIQ